MKKLWAIDIIFSDNTILCYINDFDDELKDLFRKNLNSIFHGLVEVNKNPIIYNYKNTLKDFLKRYRSKSKNLKKWMIGELLSHLLVTNIKWFTQVSIMKNKEENSIRKWFDGLYYSDWEIWYNEVKSWEKQKNIVSSTNNNKNLLDRTIDKEQGITKHLFFDKNQILWQSVLWDIAANIFNWDKKEHTIRELLTNDIPLDGEESNQKFNVLLTTVLYNTLSDKIDFEILSQDTDVIINKWLFSKVVVFSIQKNTYTKIEEFLIQESI